MGFNLAKANLIHNDKYDYSKVVYKGVYEKIEIICPIHGSFFQTPKNHMYAKAGCKQCSNLRITGSFDCNGANEIHQHKYDYSKVEYINCDTKVEIICPDHGSFFQTPYKHIKDKNGCPICKNVKFADRNRLDTFEFIERANIIHNNRYDYKLVNYIDSHTKIDIICNKHGIFKQTPTNHISNKNGCPTCSTNTSNSGNLWIDSFNNPNIIREHTIFIDSKRYKVDGYDPSTNTIYEYFGVFWHGCPTYTDHTAINPKNKIPFKILYENTLNRIKSFELAGYNLIYQWGV